MKVLLVTQDMPPRPGGMARYYAALAAGLGSAGRVAATRWEGSAPRGADGTPVWDLGIDAEGAHRPLAAGRMRRSLGRYLADWSPGVIACGNPRPFAGLCARLARGRRSPWIAFHHGADILRTESRWNRLLRRPRWKRLLDGPALHVANSTFTADLLLGFGIRPNRIAVVHPEVDTTRFRPVRDPDERDALRREFGFPRDGFLTLFVGRLVPRKGVDRLVRELAGLPRDVHLVVAGPGERDPWMDAARAAGVADRVRFLGKVAEDRLPGLYRTADLFATPSRARKDQHDVEGFGIVYLEAAASGVPVLAAATGGVGEAVADGETGILVPPDDGEALGAAWLGLIREAERRGAMALAGPRHAARFGPGTSARALLAALESHRVTAS